MRLAERPITAKFFVRGGDVLSAAVVYLGTTVVGIGVTGFATANVVLTLVWLGVVFLILRQQRDLNRDTVTTALP
jgi:hypothetical protein